MGVSTEGQVWRVAPEPRHQILAGAREGGLRSSLGCFLCVNV